MPSITVPEALLGTAAIGGATAIIGADAAGSAADAQISASNQASQTQLKMFQDIQQLERPFVNEGYGAQNMLNYLLGLPSNGMGGPGGQGGGGGGGGAPGGYPGGYPSTGTPGGLSAPLGGGGTGTPAGMQPAYNLPPGLDLSVMQDGPRGGAPGGPGGAPGGPGGAPGAQGGVPGQLTPEQLQQIMKDRPDVAAEYQKAAANGSAQQRGLNSQDAYVADWYNRVRPSLGDSYALPPSAPQGPPAPDPTSTALSAAGLGPGTLLKPYKDFTPFKDFVPPDPSKIAEDPSFKFRLAQGEEAINNRASVTGAGGNTLKALMDYGQGAASDEYWKNYTAQNAEYWSERGAYTNEYWNEANTDTARKQQIFNWLQTLMGSGQNAAANLGALGSSTATAIAGNQIGAGNAAAAGQVGAANAITGGLAGAGNNALLYTMLNRPSGVYGDAATAGLY